MSNNNCNLLIHTCVKLFILGSYIKRGKFVIEDRQTSHNWTSAPFCLHLFIAPAPSSFYCFSGIAYYLSNHCSCDRCDR